VKGLLSLSSLYVSLSMSLALLQESAQGKFVGTSGLTFFDLQLYL
jgi:hypothetical protein